MTDSFNETKRELYELMQRSRRERFTPPTPEGVTPSEARTMMTVSALQHTCEDVRPGRVAELTHTTPSALSQTFKTLEEKGLIERHRASGDYRAVSVSLTEEGERFARHFRMGLFNLLRRSPDITVGAIRIQPGGRNMKIIRQRF